MDREHAQTRHRKGSERGEKENSHGVSPRVNIGVEQKNRLAPEGRGFTVYLLLPVIVSIPFSLDKMESVKDPQSTDHTRERAMARPESLCHIGA
jgi:hypothetical protein